MIPSTSRFAERALRAGLVTSDTLDKLDRWAEQHGQPDSDVAVARLMVRAGRLTAFQAQLLLRGVTKGFILGPYQILDRLNENEICRYFTARHRQTGQKHVLAVLRLTQSSARGLAEFRRRAQSGTLPDLPPGAFREFYTLEDQQVAVFGEPVSESARETPDELPVIDGLPVVNGPAIELPLILAEEDPDLSVVPGLARYGDEDESIQVAAVRPPILATAHGGYAVRDAHHESRRPRISRNFLRRPSVVAAIIVSVALVALLVLLRSYLAVQ
jgi:hypothetical protein